MFLDPDGDLRQGDICELRALPVWHLNTTTEYGDSEGDGIVMMQVKPLTKAIARGVSGGILVAIASQCCDLRPLKRTGVIVAPVRQAPEGGRNEELNNEIRASHEVYGNAYAHIGLFPISFPRDDDLYVIDMTLMTAMMPSDKALQTLTQTRVMQMEPEWRTLFRLKLGALMARPPEEDLGDPTGTG